MKPLLFCLLLASTAVLAADAPAVPVSQEPHHHMVLQNQYTRVYDVTLPPHQATLLFRDDNDYLAVIVDSGDVQNEVAGRNSAGSGHAGKGDVRFAVAPVVHRLVNKGDTTFRNVTIEILNQKRAQKSPSDSERGLEIGHGGLADIVVDNSEVRVQDVQIATGGMLHKHTHKFPFLVVAITELDLHNIPHGKPARMIHLKAGDVRWIGPGATHEVMNMGKQEAHFIEVEFK